LSLKIAIVVHGRFHAFDLARALIQQGQEVVVYTNYPIAIAEKFGIPRQCMHNFLLHGVLSRINHRLHQLGFCQRSESFFHIWFSRWAAQQIAQQPFDVIHCFSGVAEELFATRSASSQTLKTLVRGSSHIRVQHQLLLEEEQRAGVPIDKPDEWIIQREEREYLLADAVFVLSQFAQQSFIDQGFAAERLRVLPLGAQLSLFRPASAVIAERCSRMMANQPLRILMVGTFSLRKGAVDFVKIAANAGANFSFRFVGAIGPDATALLKPAAPNIEFTPKQPQHELPPIYDWADLFIFTTIEDGYAVVLAQAQAAGLPILATPNSAAPELIRDGETGWILPIRCPEAFIERLQWCHDHRPELTQMVQRVYEKFESRDWAEVAQDFVASSTELLARKSRQETNTLV
jgi:glycosyltransferase involved in cell wall biosynthesis